ncbi:MAG TPA: hypothetical protein VJQ44_04280 [Gemmatimonadales bacterium]|nr:hypothetical protein [Gemmatimonadales bacterium]
MADQPKQPWHKSIPGLLTATTGFIAALSGLVAGLNQLGVFRREPPPSAVVGVSPTPSDNTAQDTVAADRGQATAPKVVEPPPVVSASPPPAPKAGGVSSAPAPAPSPSATGDTTTTPAASRLAKGTALELTVPTRTCAPEQGQRRFIARLDSPVRASGGTVLPAGTTAVLHLRRAGSPEAPRARLDSLVRPDLAVAIPSAQVQIPRGSANGVCLKADARLHAVLGQGVNLPAHR